MTTIPEGNEPYWQSYLIFIVRDERPADILFQCSDNTWQASIAGPTIIRCTLTRKGIKGRGLT
jgi:hypothetical protein